MCGVSTEATFEVLPRLDEIKFGSGVIDELLFLDLPRERRFNSGIMMLEYGEAVQETVYEHLRVVREGQLRVIFTPDLKVEENYYSIGGTCSFMYLLALLSPYLFSDIILGILCTAP